MQISYFVGTHPLSSVTSLKLSPTSQFSIPSRPTLFEIKLFTPLFSKQNEYSHTKCYIIICHCCFIKWLIYWENAVQHMRTKCRCKENKNQKTKVFSFYISHQRVTYHRPQTDFPTSFPYLNELIPWLLMVLVSSCTSPTILDSGTSKHQVTFLVI